MVTRAKPAASASAAASEKASAKATRPAKAPAASAAAKRSSTAAVAAAAASLPFLRFQLTPELQRRVDDVLTAIEQSAAPAAHGDALADVVAELTDAGLSHYYLRGLKSAKVGFVVEQSTRLAVSGAGKLISSVCRKYLVRMDDAQLVAIAGHMRELGR